MYCIRICIWHILFDTSRINVFPVGLITPHWQLTPGEPGLQLIWVTVAPSGEKMTLPGKFWKDGTSKLIGSATHPLPRISKTKPTLVHSRVENTGFGIRKSWFQTNLKLLQAVWPRLGKPIFIHLFIPSLIQKIHNIQAIQNKPVAKDKVLCTKYVFCMPVGVLKIF